jgi:hypothetical protein
MWDKNSDQIKCYQKDDFAKKNFPTFKIVLDYGKMDKLLKTASEFACENFLISSKFKRHT